MVRQLSRALMTACLVLAPGVVRAQTQELTLNLAGGTTQAIEVETGDYRIVLTNFLPHATYIISIGPAVPTLLPPLTREAVAAEPAECGALTKLKSQAADQPSEEAMATLITQLTPELAKCDALAKEEFRQATRRVDEQTFDMPQGTTRTVLIKRVQVNEKVGERTFTVTLKAPDRGRWITTYGVGLTPDRSDRFFLKPAGENQFAVTAQQNHKDQLNYIPAVFFTWLSREQQMKSVSRGWTAGLGFESERPAIFAGYHWGWNQNLGLMAGIAVHQQKRLNGRYTVTDIVTDTLTDEQLHENIPAPNAVIALTVRFGSNPFAGEPKPAKPDTEAEKKEQAEKDKKAGEEAAKKAQKEKAAKKEKTRS
jgi:hypothetical protein